MVPILILGWLCLAAPVLPPQDGGTQDVLEFSDRQRDFMKELQKQLDLKDVRAAQREVRMNQQIAGEVADLTFNFYGRTGDAKALDSIDGLITTMDQVEGGTRLQKRKAFLLALTPQARGVWTEVCQHAYDALMLFDEANTRKEPETWKKAAEKLAAVVVQAGGPGLDDIESRSYCRYRLAICYENLSEYHKEYVEFAKALEEWPKSGRPEDEFYHYMESKNAELKSKGYDLSDSPPPGGDHGAGNAGGDTPEKKSATTSYKEGSKWQDWTSEFKEMRSPDQFPSTSPWCNDFILLWREFDFSEKGIHKLGALNQAAPFGKPLSILHEGAHAFIREGEDKKSDVQVKVLDNKPTLTTLKQGGKDGERFSLFLTTGGQNAMFFGSARNYQQGGRYRVGWYREAKVLGERLILLDDNCTGQLGDPIDSRDNILSGWPEWVDNDGLIVGKELMPWSDVIPIGGKWVNLQLVDKHGKQLRTRELDIETGQVALKWSGPVAPRTLVIGEIRDFKGCYYDIAGGKPVTVPVGHYEIAYGVIETGKGPQLKQAWIFKGDAKAFDVYAGKSVTLEMGAPYKFDFSVKSEAKSVKIEGKSLLVHDKSGAIVGRIYDEVPLPEVWTRSDESGNGSPGKPLGRIDNELFSKDNAAAWFPADYVLDKPKDKKLEVQLKLAKHALLGGPFTSDWK